MSKTFVRILSRVDCKWEGLSPVYRLYLNDELFSERTWTWTDSYLEEALQVQAAPGTYTLRYELVAPHLATLEVGELTVDYGPAVKVNNVTFRITQ